MNNNKLIAEFMDLRSTGMSIYKESEYKYHTEWNWLMPVVEIGSKIDVTYQAVVEFIKEHNDG
jgi:hypothetical protein